MESEDALNFHARTLHNRTFQCIKCQETFATEYEIKVHVARHVIQEGTLHECRICGQVRVLRSHLIRYKQLKIVFSLYIKLTPTLTDFKGPTISICCRRNSGNKENEEKLFKGLKNSFCYRRIFGTRFYYLRVS